MQSPVVSAALAPFTQMDQRDWRALQGHAVAASSGFFVAAIILTTTAPNTKKLCTLHAAKVRGPLQALANAIDNELGALLGGPTAADGSSAAPSSVSKRATNSKPSSLVSSLLRRKVTTTDINNEDDEDDEEDAAQILVDSRYYSAPPPANSEYNARQLGPYSSPIDDYGDDSDYDEGGDGEEGVLSPPSQQQLRSDSSAGLLARYDASSGSGSPQRATNTNKSKGSPNDFSPLATSQPSTAAVGEAIEKRARSVADVVGPPPEPEELSLLATLKSLATVIHNARLEPNREFGRSVGAEVLKMQRRVARIFVDLGFRSCVDICLAYAICVALDRARAGTRLGEFAFFRPTVVGTGGGTGFGGDPSSVGADYFLSSSFRFFLFTSFSCGSAANGFLSYALRTVGLGGVNDMLTVGTSGAASAAEATGIVGWLSRAAYFYDDSHPAMAKRKLFLSPAFAIKSLLFQIATHGVLTPMRLPSGLLPIAYEGAYLPTLARLGPSEMAYWLFLQKFVYSGTIISRLLIGGQFRSVVPFLSLLCATDKPGRIRRLYRWGAGVLARSRRYAADAARVGKPNDSVSSSMVATAGGGASVRSSSLRSPSQHASLSPSDAERFLSSGNSNNQQQLYQSPSHQQYAAFGGAGIPSAPHSHTTSAVVGGGVPHSVVSRNNTNTSSAINTSTYRNTVTATSYGSEKHNNSGRNLLTSPAATHSLSSSSSGNGEKKEVGRSSRADALWYRLGFRAAVEVTRLGIILGVCTVGVRAAAHDAEGRTGRSLSSPSTLLWGLLGYYNRYLFLFYDARKGPAYVWSLML